MTPSMHRLTSFALAVAATVCTCPLVAQTFYSPANPNGMINDADTILRPQWMHETSLIIRRSSPTLADLNGDGDLEVIVGDLAGDVHVLDPVTGEEMPGWPQRLTAAIDSTAAVGDVDGDGQPEIVISCGVPDAGQLPAGSWSAQQSGAIYVFNPDGSLVLRFATQDWLNHTAETVGPDGFTEPVNNSPALADLDGDGILEIVQGTHDRFIYALNVVGGAAEYRPDGTLAQYDTTVTGPCAGSVFRLDNDGDGRWDEDPPGEWTPFPYGDGAPGWRGVDDDGDGLIDESGIDTNGDGYPDHSVAHPVDDDEDSDNPFDASINWDRVDEDGFEWPHMGGDSIWASPAIADVDKDGFLDVIQPVDRLEGTKMFVLSRCACSLPGWDNVALASNVWTPVSCGDVDGDGFLEFFMGTNTWYSPDFTAWRGGFIFGLNHDGTEMRDGDGNPATFGIFNTTAPNPWDPDVNNRPFVMGAPAIGDLDGDGQPEIVVGGARPPALCAWNGDGSNVPGFPVSATFPTYEGPRDIGWVMGSPILVDLDGDGDVEICFQTASAYFIAYRHDGTVFPGTPFWGIDFGSGVKWFGDTWSTPAAGDIDNDGRIEIVFAGRDHSIVDQGHGRIFCIEGGPYNPLGQQWPMLSANAQGTGVYQDPRQGGLRGDVNEDGGVDSADLVRMRNALQGTEPLDPDGKGYINSLVNSDLVFDQRDFDALVDLLLTMP
jgi:hypothetical protein